MLTTINPGFANNSYSVTKQLCGDLARFMPLENQPEFPVEVDGKYLLAKLTGNTDCPVQVQLIVEFSNGVTELFYQPREMWHEWYADNKKNIKYAKAIEKKLEKLYSENYLKFRYF